jgi:hypothetical protein
MNQQKSESGMPHSDSLCLIVTKATVDPRWTAWARPLAAPLTNSNAVLGTNNVTAGTFGFASGQDYHFTTDSVLGFVLAGGGTNRGLAQVLAAGGATPSRPGSMVQGSLDRLMSSPVLAFTNNWMSSNRIALGDQLTASFNGQGSAQGSRPATVARRCRRWA